MKNLGEVNFFLGIQLLGYWKNKMIALSQFSYIDKVFEKLAMQDSNKGGQPSRFGIVLSLDDYPKTSKEKEYIEKGSLCFGYWNFCMYDMLCTTTDKDLRKSIFVLVYLIFVLTPECG